MEKQHIIEEIIRTAKENGGSPLGQARFSSETGIAKSDWFGKHWARWGDTVREAGYSANQMVEAYDREFLLEALARLILDLGRFPASGDLRLKARCDPKFPAHTTFDRLGTRKQVTAMVA